MKTKDGGPVFPLCGSIVKQYQPTGIITGESLQGYQSGMSLRDYFAIHAPEADILYYYRLEEGCKTRQQARYMYADAMLEARKI